MLLSVLDPFGGTWSPSSVWKASLTDVSKAGVKTESSSPVAAIDFSYPRIPRSGGADACRKDRVGAAAAGAEVGRRCAESFACRRSKSRTNSALKLRAQIW